MDWYDYDNMCIITKIEHYFRTGVWIKKPLPPDQAPEFFRPILQSFGFNIDRSEAHKINLYMFLITILIATHRL